MAWFSSVVCQSSLTNLLVGMEAIKNRDRFRRIISINFPIRGQQDGELRFHCWNTDWYSNGAGYNVALQLLSFGCKRCRPNFSIADEK